MIHFPSVVFLFTQFWHTEVSSLNSNADNKIVDNDINVNVTSPPLSVHLHHPEQYNHKDLFKYQKRESSNICVNTGVAIPTRR